MSVQFPRFNQDFVRNLNEGSEEARFVSSVGDYTFLAREHADKINEVNLELRRPVTFGLFTSQEELDTYAEQFNNNFETVLSNEGLDELVFALNSLKVATDALKGRKLSWIDPISFTNESTIAGSRIGFDFYSLSAPALDVELTDDIETSDTYLSPLPLMWDIEVKP